MCEQLNQSLINMLRTHPCVGQGVQHTEHSPTGYAASCLMFGWYVRLPVDVELGVDNPQVRYERDSWLGEHHEQLIMLTPWLRGKLTRPPSNTR